MPYSRKLTPPMTGAGMLMMRPDALPMKDSTIEKTAAPPMTQTL